MLPETTSLATNELSTLDPKTATDLLLRLIQHGKNILDGNSQLVSEVSKLKEKIQTDESIESVRQALTEFMSRNQNFSLDSETRGYIDTFEQILNLPGANAGSNVINPSLKTALIDRISDSAKETKEWVEAIGETRDKLMREDVTEEAKNREVRRIIRTAQDLEQASLMLRYARQTLDLLQHMISPSANV